MNEVVTTIHGQTVSIPISGSGPTSIDINVYGPGGLGRQPLGRIDVEYTNLSGQRVTETSLVGGQWNGASTVTIRTGTIDGSPYMGEISITPNDTSAPTGSSPLDAPSGWGRFANWFNAANRVLSPIDDVYSGTYGVPGYSISTNSTSILDGGLIAGQEYDPSWLASNGITPHNLPPGFVPIYSAVGQFTGIEVDPDYTPGQTNHCFLGDTPIQMWPLDPSIKPRADGSYDETFVLSKVWEKPISEIRVGDIVVAYDDKGRLAPKRVLRTMENTATHILDFWGTGVTPGHAYFCADGPNKGGHAPIMDILRMDGALMRADGTMYRAATNCKVGSMGDMMIHASATLQKPDGTWTEPKPGKVRFGTRIILPDGRHMSFMEMAASEGWKVTDDGYMVGMMKGEDGAVEERAFHFPYSHGEELPKPEDYILARSKVSLEAIYAAGEWEQIGTRMPAPVGMVGLNTNHTSTLLQPSKPEPNVPPAFDNHPDAPHRRRLNRTS